MVKKILIFSSLFFLMVIMVLLYQANNKHEVPRIDYIEAYNHMNDQEIYIEDQEIINKIKEVMKSGFALPGLADMEVPADLELKLVYSDQAQVKIGFYILKKRLREALLCGKEMGDIYG